MFLNYLKIAIRNLLRHKLTTFINIVGLSLGIACCVLIMLYLHEEMSYDRFNSKATTLYRVLAVERNPDGTEDAMSYVPMPLVPALKAEIPEVVRAAHFVSGGAILTDGDKAFAHTVMFTDHDLFDMFDFRFLRGSSDAALRDPHELVITDAIAKKFFGDADPIGKSLTMKTRRTADRYTIVGVVAPMPATSSLQFEVLADITQQSMFDRNGTRWQSSNGSAFVQLVPGATAEAARPKLRAIVEKNLGEDIKQRQQRGRLSKGPDALRYDLQSLVDVHLGVVRSSQEDQGSPTNNLILAGIALLVLAIACINFVTLAVARSAHRAREVGMRKVVGAGRAQLVGQFWGEAFLLCLVALVVGLLLAQAGLPSFNEFAQKRLTLGAVAEPSMLAGVAILLALVSVVAGGYPAYLMARFEPAGVLKGSIRLSGKNLFARSLVVFQFALSIFLVCAALILAAQTRFLISKDLGFRPEQVAVLTTFAGDSQTAETVVDRLRTRLAGRPEFLHIAGTSGAFTKGSDIEGFQYNGENKSSYVYRVDEDYLATLGIPLLEGRNFKRGEFDRGGSMIVNEAFLKSMGWTRPALGKKLVGIKDEFLSKMEVIGVMPDFHFTSLEREIRPMILFMNSEWPLDNIVMRIAPTDIPGTVEELRNAWKEVSPGTPFELTFMDEDFRGLYESEMRWGRIVSAGSGFAVALAALGILGLAALSVASRTKEIGIRKVLGSSASALVRLLSKEFLILVSAANILAWPLAHLAATSYLEHYAYHIALTPWIFLAAGAGALTIAFLVIAGQVWRAARANPVEALRYE